MNTPPVIGSLPSGLRNSISDVGRVRVGHCTLDQGPVQTGVTVVLAHDKDPFLHKVPASAVVLNGFGKSIGLIQLEELGVFETSIALSNTFAVSALAQAQIHAALAAHPAIGREWGTINPLVFECNDSYLNDIRALAITEDHYQHALTQVSDEVVQGSVGAGRGMSAFELKGGIGSASRCTGNHTVGALVLANFGKLPMLTLAGQALGQQLTQGENLNSQAELGSIIILLATDAPLDARQLRRLALRAGAGLAKTGSIYGHGSGDIAMAFSTAYTLPHHSDQAMPNVAMLHETKLDPLFQAAAEATEQAIIHALWYSQPVTGRDGHYRQTLHACLKEKGIPCIF